MLLYLPTKPVFKSYYTVSFLHFVFTAINVIIIIYPRYRPLGQTDVVSCVSHSSSPGRCPTALICVNGIEKTILDCDAVIEMRQISPCITNHKARLVYMPSRRSSAEWVCMFLCARVSMADKVYSWQYHHRTRRYRCIIVEMRTSGCEKLRDDDKVEQVQLTRGCTVCTDIRDRSMTEMRRTMHNIICTHTHTEREREREGESSLVLSFRWVCYTYHVLVANRFGYPRLGIKPFGWLYRLNRASSGSHALGCLEAPRRR